MRIQLTLYIYLNNIGRWCFFALTFVYKWLDYAKISKLKRVLVDSIFNYCFIVYLKCWLLIYALYMVWRQWSHSEVPGVVATMYVCVYTLFAHAIICLLCLCCERPFVHFTGMNINCNWLMWALCVDMRATYTLCEWLECYHNSHTARHTDAGARYKRLLRQRTASDV